MKNKLNFRKYYDRLDPDIRTMIDGYTKDRNHLDKSICIERVGVENKEMVVEGGLPQCVGYISRAVTDHSLDFMVPTGVNTSIFDLNPVVFFNHQSSGLPVGKCIGFDIVDDGVKTITEFATDVDFSNDIYKLVKGSFLNTFSIGFIALEYHMRGEKSFGMINDEMKNKYPTYDGEAGRIITKWLLLEYSVVGIPDNFAALVTDKNLDLSDTTIKILKPAEKQIDKTITKVIDRSIHVLGKEKEQKIIRLSQTQKQQIENYYTLTLEGKLLRYSISDIIDGKV